MVHSESIPFDQEKVTALRRLVAQGENHGLEFKRRVTSPDKVVRELIAFANSKGGTLLVGVDDDRSIPGVKFPEEESHALQRELDATCRPQLEFHETIIPTSEKRFVLQWDVRPSERRPHFHVADGVRSSYVRQKDQTLKASPLMIEVLRRSKSKNGVRLPYGEAERKILRHLAEHPHVNLEETIKITGLNRYMASRKIVRLVLANVLRIVPTEKGDLFCPV